MVLRRQVVALELVFKLEGFRLCTKDWQSSGLGGSSSSVTAAVGVFTLGEAAVGWALGHVPGEGMSPRESGEATGVSLGVSQLQVWACGSPASTGRSQRVCSLGRLAFGVRPPRRLSPLSAQGP